MSDMTAAEIRTELQTLRAVRTKRMSGGQITKSSYPETGSIEFAAISLEELNMEIARLEGLLARKTGRSSTRAIFPGLGTRP